MPEEETLKCPSVFYLIFYFRLDIRKFAFSSRIVDRWNSLFECCVTCNSVNCFKSHISSKLEPETTRSVDILERALYGIKPVPTKPSVRRYWWPSVNSVNMITQLINVSSNPAC